MARYELVIKQSVVKDLRSIPKQHRQRILTKIELLADEPRPPGSEKLSGQERYRIRQGSYRILYVIEDQRLVVTVIKVGH